MDPRWRKEEESGTAGIFMRRRFKRRSLPRPRRRYPSPSNSVLTFRVASLFNFLRPRPASGENEAAALAMTDALQRTAESNPPL